jgi:hypothetical protein
MDLPRRSPVEMVMLKADMFQEKMGFQLLNYE